MKKSYIFEKGFTVIELLVTIAIIGLLASIVLVSIGSARSKGWDGKTQNQLSDLRSAATLYQHNNNTYDICAAPSSDTTGVYSMRQSSNYNGQTVTCNSTSVAWAVGVPLVASSGYYWCVDSRGASEKNAGSLGVATVCP